MNIIRIITTGAIAACMFALASTLSPTHAEIVVTPNESTKLRICTDQTHGPCVYDGKHMGGGRSYMLTPPTKKYPLGRQVWLTHTEAHQLIVG